MLQLPKVAWQPSDYQLHSRLLAEASAPVQMVEELLNSSETSLSEQQHGQLHWLVAVSPFITRVLQRYGTAALQRLFAPHAANLDQVQLQQAANEQQAMAQIRQFRHIEMARIAALDLLGEMPLGRMLQENSALADGLIGAAAEYVQQQLAPRYGYAYDSAGEQQSLIILAMGKLGGRELNFSSDIDLIFAYPESGETRGGRQNTDVAVYFNRYAQQLIKLLDQITGDGRAFRIDMRLRPFGQSGPLVSSLAALEDYYHEQGRTWERYALIKARVLNTSQSQAEAVYALLRPFIYRRYLDYSAIDALRKMKLLINQEARRKGVVHNIKLGLGGIREVEFIAQVFQLIRGGREHDLQTSSLLSALSACGQQAILTAETLHQLVDGYAYLRKVEHVLQEINDEQTQQLPSDELGRMRVLAATGFSQSEAGWQAFMHAIQQAMDKVHQEFLAVIGGEQDMLAEDTSEYAILWQDLLADDTALEVLSEAGASDPAACWQVIREFRMLLRKRPSGPRGRELQALLVPALLELALAQPATHTVLQRTFEVVAHISSRTTYLELLCENAEAREQLVFLCAASPWIAHLIAKFPLLLDELIDPIQLYQLPDVESYRYQVGEYLMRLPSDDAEAQMDTLRQVKQIFQLKVAAADLNEAVHLMRVSDHLTYLAEAMIEHVVLLAWRQLAERHGTPPGRTEQDTGFAVVAYGKLGGYELGYGSDLDLVFLCDDDISGDTDGNKPIAVQQFYLRLAQRVLHLFTTRTLSGVLYDVDMRLRPSGQSGLMVVRVATYHEYLAKEAWTWELQALVRARMVFGAIPLVERFNAIRRNLLCQPRDISALQQDIVSMREKMRNHLWKEQANGCDIKQMPGGIADIEFITQYLVLAHSGQYSDLAVWTDNIRILEAANQCGLLTTQQVQALVQAYQTYRTEVHRLALAEAGGCSEQQFTSAREQVITIWQSVLPLGIVAG